MADQLLASPWLILLVAGLGMCAGMLGGLLGVGGSVIMIPGLTLLFGRDQHLYQAVAMVANVAVAIPAARRHYQSGTARPDVLRFMMPSAIVCVLLGVWISNRPIFAGNDGGQLLARVFAVFLVYVIAINIRKLWQSRSDKAPQPDAPGTPDAPNTADNASDTRDATEGGGGDKASAERITAARSSTVGVIMGTMAGLLGIGGGAQAVPLQQVLLKLPLRSCIANSSMVICFSAAIGGAYKVASLGPSGADQSMPSWQHALIAAAVLAPTAFLGGRLGASLTHRLPLGQVRLIFVLLMAVAAWRMAGIGM